MMSGPSPFHTADDYIASHVKVGVGTAPVIAYSDTKCYQAIKYWKNRGL